MRSKLTYLILLISLSATGQNLDDNSSKSLFKIRPYKPIYFLVANYTNNVNSSPSSGNPLNTVQNPQSLDRTELKFQLSFKAKIAKIRSILGMNINADLFAAYTQTSRWQFYNTDESRPFRETNYEPELFIQIPIDSGFESWKGVFWGFGLNHQSNGRSLPFSRSWNRLIFQLGIERDNYFILFKPWLRFEENPAEDDNPGIQDFLGRFELSSAYKKERHHFSLILRHSLRTGNRSRGSFRFNYAIELKNYLKVHTQVFSGYGESLLDYNHRQTTFGIGISLIDWLDEF